MKDTLTRRSMLKMLAAGSAGLASTVLVGEAGASAAARSKPRLRQTTEITYWTPPHWRFGADNKTVAGTGSDAWIKDAIARFESEYPSYKVNLELIPWDQWSQKITTAFASGDLPNVLYANLAADKIDAGLYDPIDEFLTPDMLADWMPGVQENLTFYGNIYGVPAFQNPDMTALSKSALEQHGGAGILDAIGANRGGLTFDMMKSYGEEFGDGARRFFLGVPTDHGSIVYWTFGAWLTGWGANSWSENHDRWVLHEQESAIQAFQWYLDAQNDWKIMIPNLPKWSDVDSFYWNLNSAMRTQWPGIAAELAVAQEAGQAPEDFEIVLAGHPHLEGMDPFVPGSLPGHHVITHTDDPAKREAAFAWAYWLGMDNSNAEAWLVNGTCPASLSGAKAVENHELMQDPNYKWILQEYLPNFKTSGPGGNWQPALNARTSQIWNELNPWDYYVQQFQSLLLGQKSPEEMLNEMANRINGALGVD
ncbi:extracellular solute-binding protein [Aggregatilinea lenta]|uniref:extracellular solute-binding protein n=1 Tax=Aggregatilinea lenta TaxID=913108 RepID=UPI000E5B7FD5|nr:extracellular solute-binding protein [Aggregatilinea lenta]